MRFSIFILALVSTVIATEGKYPRRQSSNSTGTAPYQLQKGPLDTDWTEKVGTNPWPEYPRPQLERSEWKNLNGIWQYQNATSRTELDSPPFGKSLARSVLVPFCLESALSGMLCAHCSIPNDYLLTLRQVLWASPPTTPGIGLPST
jgi:hypothetical protein